MSSEVDGVAESGVSASSSKLKFRGVSLSEDGSEVYTVASGSQGG